MARFVLLIVLSVPLWLWGQAGEDQALINFYSDADEIDQAYLRQEIKFVHYVRERLEADIHLLVTTQNTGGKGEAFTLTFIGQNRFAGVNDTLTFMVQNSETQELIRKKMIRVIKLALASYIKKLPVADNLSITYEPDSDARGGKTEDKWHNWVFSIELNEDMDGEKSAAELNLDAAINIIRVTEKWKSRFVVEAEYDEERYDYEQVHTTSISRSRGVELNIVRSLNNHWSMGAWIKYSSSTYNNLKKCFYIEPKLEYNFFPYSRSTREQLRISYGFQPRYQEYFEKTIYDKTDEMLYQQSLELNLAMVKTWGKIDLGLAAAHFFHDWRKNSLNFDSEFSLKLVRGLSLNLHGGLTYQRNQLGLPKRDATIEEVLLQRRELESQYSYYSMIGFTYSFGALYNDIVNPRFGSWW